MINLYDSHRFISKKRLAELAGVSSRTFRRYLQTRRHILEALGVSPNARMLPPIAVQYICEDYCIDLPFDLQDQETIWKSSIYQQFIHHLQNSSLEKRLEEIAKITPKQDRSGQSPHEL